jgi:hypothetical protein
MKTPRLRIQISGLLIMILVLVACTPGAGSTSAMKTNTIPFEEMTTLTTTPENGSSQPCAYMWARNQLPDISGQLMAALKEAKINFQNAWAEAYGENCMDTQSGKIQSFSTLETDFHIQLQVASLDDYATMGDLLEKVITVMNQFPPGKVPGPQEGSVEVTFSTEEDQQVVRFKVSEGVAALQQGLHGQALLEELQK